MASKLTGTKRQSFTVSDKLRIINFTEQHGNRSAEREFGVSESNARLWRKSKENLEKMDTEGMKTWVSLACAMRWPGETKKPVSLRRIWSSRDRKRDCRGMEWHSCRDGRSNLPFSNVELRTIWMDQKMILCMKTVRNLSMTTLSLEKCSSLTQSQTSKDLTFNSSHAELSFWTQIANCEYHLLR